MSTQKREEEEDQIDDNNEEDREEGEEEQEDDYHHSKLKQSNAPKELLSILKYDYKNPKPIESPRSLRAMGQVFITMDQMLLKSPNFFKPTSTDARDLERLLEKDEREVKCYIKQVNDKRKEIIKLDKRKEEYLAKEKKERDTKTKILKEQAEKAAKIRKEMEAKAAEEVEKKLEKRYQKIQEGKEYVSPFYDQYNNLNYVPKPKEYFKLSAKNLSIKQQLDLSKSKTKLLKEKQFREMGHMMDYEINLQQIKKKNQIMQRKKQEFLLSIESFKKQKFERNMNLLEEKEHKIALQKKIDEETKKENKERLMKMKYRDEMIRNQRIKENEMRAMLMKESESNYEQNRKYMIKQLLIDFEELKVGALSAEEVKQRYSYLKDEESFEKAMAELNRRRQLSRYILCKRRVMQKIREVS